MLHTKVMWIGLLGVYFLFTVENDLSTVMVFKNYNINIPFRFRTMEQSVKKILKVVCQLPNANY